MLEVNPDAIYASTLSRAYDTARGIGAILGIDTVVGDDRLQERHIGDFSGMKKPLPSDRKDHVESDQILVERFQFAIDEICVAHADGEIIITAHGGNIMYRLRSIGYEPDRRSDNTGITVLDYHPGDLQVIAYSLSDHLR